MTIKNNKMTSTTIKTNSKLLAIPVIAVLLTVFIASMPPDAFAGTTCDVPDNHCYAYVRKTISNRGGYGTIDINAANSVQSGYAIANPIWIGFSNNEWIEGGWQKGNISPCSNTTAKFYWYETLGTTSSACLETTSGATMTVKIDDSDLNNIYAVYINGVWKKSFTETRDAARMTTGGESTHQSNVLTGGEDSGLVYYTTSGVATSWGSANLSYSSHMHSYTDTRTSPYNDYQYGGP